MPRTQVALVINGLHRRSYGQDRILITGFSVRRRGRLGARKPKTGKGFLIGRPNRPARPNPYRTEAGRAACVRRHIHSGQQLTRIATERLPNLAERGLAGCGLPRAASYRKVVPTQTPPGEHGGHRPASMPIFQGTPSQRAQGATHNNRGAAIRELSWWRELTDQCTGCNGSPILVSIAA